MSDSICVRRVINACAVVTVGDATVLTDPLFDGLPLVSLREPVGVRPEELPPLHALLGGHGVLDHWQPRSLAAYPYKDQTPVWVATAGMARSARRAGFPRVEVVRPGDRRAVTATVELEVVQAQRAAGRPTVSFALRAPGASAFIGPEALAIEPLVRHRRDRGPVDVAILPIDGSRLLGQPLVMGPEEALDAAEALGARILVPFHYAMPRIPVLLETPGDVDRLRAAARGRDVEVVVLVPGEPWTWSPGHPASSTAARP